MTSCFSDGKSVDDYVVVERSKGTRPTWISLEKNKLLTSKTQFRFVAFKSKLLDLPLGIKQAQQNAVETSEQAVKNFIFAMLEAKASSNSRLSVSPKDEISLVVDQSIEKQFIGGAKVLDIYYERLINPAAAKSDQPPEFYNAYVLIGIARQDMSQLIINIAEKFKQSKDQQIRLLGSILAEGSQQILAH